MAMKYLVKFNESSIYETGAIFEMQKMDRPEFYEKGTCSGKDIKISDQNLSELYRISKIFNYDSIRYTNSYFIIFLKNLNLEISISEYEDEYFQVWIVDREIHTSISMYKCDQIQGVESLLIDLKKILDKYKLI